MANVLLLGAMAEPVASAEEVGAKAANLDRIARLGVPVPPAFVLPVNLCARIVAGETRAEEEMRDGLAEGITYLESETGRHFGDRRQPLLVSVRSGAARSMPGMLDTVLNVGAARASVRGLIRLTGNPRFAFDCERRFIESYAATVLQIDGKAFSQRLEGLLRAEGVASERDLDGEAMERLVAGYREIVAKVDAAVPDDPMEQLIGATRAVYHSWTSERACAYRALEKLEHLRGTAVTVQAMVFGNRSLRSGAGVAFSRDPSSGAAKPVIDMLFGAQGEDVVSGRRQPETEDAISATLPDLPAKLTDVLGQLERAFKDVQDVEFTVEEDQLWILQARSAKRTPRAALRFAIDMVRERLIETNEALQRLENIDLAALMRDQFVDAGEPAATGIPVSNGAAIGRAAFSAGAAEGLAAAGDPAILLRPDTSTADIAGFAAAAGIITAVGGRTAHAALVARQMGKPCVVGCRSLKIDPRERSGALGGKPLAEGDWLSVDGDTGSIYFGQCRIISERPEAELAQVAHWRAATAAPALVER